MCRKVWSLLLCLLLLLPCLARAAENRQDYPLEQVLVLSRHNIRAPLAGRDSTLAKLTPHAWFAWRCRAGELSPKGGELEMLMGQYFREWLEQEELLERNAQPAPGEVRFYANSFQRTIATARYFSVGMLPLANVPIEHHEAVNESDPVFLPGLGKVSEDFHGQVLAEFQSAGLEQQLREQGQRSFHLIQQVLDFSQSPYAQAKGTEFPPADILPVTEGSYTLRSPFKPLAPASDALVLQYYEEENDLQASFGHELTWQDWQEIATLKEMGINTLFSLPTAAKVLAHPLLDVMHEELATEGRKFTFLCGHDVNLAAVLPALGAEEYTLPDSIEAKTPIGAKLVIEKRRGRDGQTYAALSLIYASTQQLRSRTPLNLAAPPSRCPLHLKGLQTNEDGLYLFSDLQQRLAKASAEGKSWQLPQ